MNGGELDGNTGVIKEQYVEKTVLTASLLGAIAVVLFRRKRLF